MNVAIRNRDTGINDRFPFFDHTAGWIEAYDSNLNDAG